MVRDFLIVHACPTRTDAHLYLWGFLDSLNCNFADGIYSNILKDLTKNYVGDQASIGCRECHISPDWLLIYQVDNDALKLYLLRTGTHSDVL